LHPTAYSVQVIGLRPIGDMKTTDYFERTVLTRRPYPDPAWRERILANPLRSERQADGRIRLRGMVDEFGGRIFRVVTLDDGETVHNAFPDRRFRIDR
jgi:hypothetical protein